MTINTKIYHLRPSYPTRFRFYLEKKKEGTLENKDAYIITKEPSPSKSRWNFEKGIYMPDNFNDLRQLLKVEMCFEEKGNFSPFPPILLVFLHSLRKLLGIYAPEKCRNFKGDLKFILLLERH